ncbi:hypothetical protein FACS18949_13890 [Clostridia bacterium]|nr:hypothetical protein FACS189425_02580 [Clostridia bacterium]GHV35601.1 hypothetical protein FACS18949_13890 [Clostridia bacterium]
MSKLFPKIGSAYRIISAFDEFYASNSIDEAKEKFDSLYSWMRRSRLNPMKNIAEKVKNNSERILNFFKSRLTNAICEGINSMVQAAKRKARGYNTLKGFASMIYLIVGKLDLAAPFRSSFSTTFGVEPLL